MLKSVTGNREQLFFSFLFTFYFSLKYFLVATILQEKFKIENWKMKVIFNCQE